MGKIVKKNDNDKEYIFTCPICGTIFTERERNIDSAIDIDGITLNSLVKCPNCDRCSNYSELEEYNKNKYHE